MLNMTSTYCKNMKSCKQHKRKVIFSEWMTYHNQFTEDVK